MGYGSWLVRIITETMLRRFDEIELRIYGDSRGRYTAELNLPDSKVSCRLPPLSDELVQETDPVAQGNRLFDWVFRDDVRDAFYAARWSLESSSRSAELARGIRLRLWLDPRASIELHRLRWESMRDPRRDEALSISTAFSRYFRSRTARTSVAERPIRMLIVASDTQEAEGSSFTDIDTFKFEVDQLAGLATQTLEESVHIDRMLEKPTLEQVRSQLAHGYHAVHFLVRAQDAPDQAGIVFADEGGGVRLVSFGEFAALIQGSSGIAPHLVFLTTLVANDTDLGQRLVTEIMPVLLEGGVQAVVLMPISAETSEMLGFTGRFYRVLAQTGSIDVAMMEARNTVFGSLKPDWADPVLGMRIPDGQLFYPLPEALEATLKSIGRRG